MEAYCEGAEKVAKLTLELCAIGLGVPPDTFGKHMEPSQSIARLNYYPACPTPSLTLGLGAHTDPYTLTLLHQCQVGGLQVCKDKKWITVKPRRDAFVVNVGDNLQVSPSFFSSAALPRDTLAIGTPICRNDIGKDLLPSSVGYLINFESGKRALKQNF